MANPFLTDGYKEVETALLLEQANVVDIGKAVAYADSKGRMFLNTDDNLAKILPAYDDIRMKKWLLWHEHMHITFRHHERFFKYRDTMLADIRTTAEKFNMTMQEVNIIMDILVHDWMCAKFPELIETAVANLAQMRNRNSLGYTFTTFTLEEMLDEYRKYKAEETEDDSKEGEGEPSDDDGEPTDESTPTEDPGTPSKKKKKSDKKDDDSRTPSTPSKHKDDDKADEDTPDSTPTPTPSEENETEEEAPVPEHDKTDWSKLDDIDNEEFIDEEEGDRYIRKSEELRRKKIRLGKITQALNALSTTAKIRTYAVPSSIRTGSGIILKGRKPGKTALYLVFDASGSMGGELRMFKDIIQKSVPQAIKCPCEWFSGWKRGADYSDPTKYDKTYNHRTCWDYHKGTFEDILTVEANDGYNDDGDRTIDLCFLAEQKGYSPVGVTDGGWTGDDGYFLRHDQSREQLKALKRTVIVSQQAAFIEEVKRINPTIQTIYVGD